MRVCERERERERESDRRLLILGRAAHVHTHLGEAECACVILPERAASVNAFDGAHTRTRHTTHASTCACTHRLTRAQIPWSGPAHMNLTCAPGYKRIYDAHTCIHARIYNLHRHRHRYRHTYLILGPHTPGRLELSGRPPNGCSRVRNFGVTCVLVVNFS